MRNTLIAAAALVIVAGLEQSTPAVCVDDAVYSIRAGYHQIHTGYHRNEMWPWPFVCADRLAVREPFCVMVHNGWRRQNLLGPHHFTPEGDELTTAGQLRVRWIATQAPPERRSIFVERADDPDVTRQRLTAARDYAAQLTYGQMPQVVETHLVSEGRPAGIVDVTNVRFQQTMPAPTLPAAAVGFSAGQP